MEGTGGGRGEGERHGPGTAPARDAPWRRDAPRNGGRPPGAAPRCPRSSPGTGLCAATRGPPVAPSPVPVPPQDEDVPWYRDVPVPSPPGQGHPLILGCPHAITPGQGHPHQFGAGAPAQNQCPRGDGALLALVPLPQLIPSACHGTPRVQSHPPVCHSHAAPCKASSCWG